MGNCVNKTTLREGSGRIYKRDFDFHGGALSNIHSIEATIKLQFKQLIRKHQKQVGDSRYLSSMYSITIKAPQAEPHARNGVDFSAHVCPPKGGPLTNAKCVYPTASLYGCLMTKRRPLRY